jgi:hypothetical protein
VRTRGHRPRRTGEDKERQMCFWLAQQQRKMKEGALSADKRDKLTLVLAVKGPAARAGGGGGGSAGYGGYGGSGGGSEGGEDGLDGGEEYDQGGYDDGGGDDDMGGGAGGGGEFGEPVAV